MTVELASAPPIPGLRFRRLQRPADDAVISGLLNAGNAADSVPRRISAAQVASWLDHPSNQDLDEDLLFAEVEGVPVAYAEGGWEQDNDGGRNYSTWGRCTDGVAAAWARRCCAGSRSARRGSRPRIRQRRSTAESWVNDTEVGRIALLEANGYGIVRYDYEMDDQPRRHPELPRPEGISCARLARRTCAASSDRGRGLRDHWGAMNDSDGSLRADARRPAP